MFYLYSVSWLQLFKHHICIPNASHTDAWSVFNAPENAAPLHVAIYPPVVESDMTVPLLNNNQMSLYIDP